MTGLEPLALAGLAVGAPPLVESCTKACAKLVNIIRDIKTADAQVERRLHRVALLCREAALYLQCITFVENRAPEQVGEDLNTFIRQVLIDSETLYSTVEGMKDLRFHHRLHFGLMGKRSVQDHIKQLESTLKMFHRFVNTTLLFLDGGEVDRLLRDILTGGEGQEAIQQLREIRSAIRSRQQNRSNINLASIEVNGSYDALAGSALSLSNFDYMGGQLIMESKTFRPSDEAELSNETKVQDLTFALSDIDPTRIPGILRCMGYQVVSKHDYHLLYEYPASSSEPMTLRNMLWDSAALGGPQHPLNERLEVAIHLAKAGLSVHLQGYIHKQIRPESVLLFRSNTQQSGFPLHLGTPYLLGFGSARKDTDDSAKMGDTSISHNVYRHPKRQGEKYSEKYLKIDDLYAFGVVLLEIGVWRSSLSKANELNPKFWVNTTNCPTTTYPEVLKGLAKSSVPVVMGVKYYRIVQTCLSVLEDDSPFLAPDVLGSTERMTMKFCLLFITKVLMELESIVV